MRTEKPIHQNLKNLDVDEDETCIDDDVHDACNGAHDHFGLPHGDPGHGGPTLTFSVAQLDVASQIDVAPNLKDAFPKQEPRGSQKEGENQLSDKMSHSDGVGDSVEVIGQRVHRALH